MFPARADLRDAVEAPPVDLVLNLSTSFGCFDDDRDNQRVLANPHRSLRAGGALVVEVAGKEVLARAGFSEVCLYGDAEGAPHGAAAKRPVAVARKV